MGFSYKRPVGERNTYKNFEIGVHPALIKKVKLDKTKADKPKFTIIVNGKDGESGLYNLIFGNDYTEKNFNYILASIEDNGTEIPDIDFDYNLETATFLTGKNVYIKVELSDWNGELVPTITEFLNEEEFEAVDDTPTAVQDSNN
ncbi:hypothetical protein PEG85_13140 [Lactococcus cremoris]|uniref:hypothetical protein n=1 Tax=Lactococcus lactis subsp. cremoris TaxID=1359 RepID=UPI0022E671CF|nr:hypothetical protein [Lactococcus cremoris]MDA2881901.1 hypothetical protein [Lactococcus cremoris]MDA2884376.1 hypothetical protein [Lactococcus cremoris]